MGVDDAGLGCKRVCMDYVDSAAAGRVQNTWISIGDADKTRWMFGLGRLIEF